MLKNSTLGQEEKDLERAVLILTLTSSQVKSKLYSYKGLKIIKVPQAPYC